MIQRVFEFSLGAQKETYFYMLVFISNQDCPSSFVTEILSGNSVSYSCMHKAQTLITKTGSHMLKSLSGSCFLEAGKHSRTYLRIVPLPTVKQMCLQGLHWRSHALQSEEGVVFKCAKQFWFWMLLLSGLDFPPFCHWREAFPRE